jgi:hypothetical protein
MYDVELCDGVPANYKIALAGRKPPLVLHILYLDFKHRGITFFGSFKHKEPNDMQHELSKTGKIT